jgi:hypothetical protein
MRQRTPQEKKELSYERDRRNAYGENDKSSRRAIRLRKRLSARSYRRTSKQALPAGAVAADDPLVEEAESWVRSRTQHPGGWPKFPDIPLRDFVARQQLASDARPAEPQTTLGTEPSAALRAGVNPLVDC